MNNQNIYKMKLSLLKISIIVILFTGKNIFSQNAEQTLKNISKNMSNQSKMYLEFEYVLNNKAAKINQKLFGKLSLEKNKYHLDFMQNTIIHDGEKIYNINNEDKEINVINPEDIEPEDETLLNPRYFLSLYKNQYFYSWYKKSDKRLKKYKYIQAIPKKKKERSLIF